jgi:hypothetical protein
LLHLGNSGSFSVDNKLRLSYDFPTSTRPRKPGTVPLSHVTLRFSSWPLFRRIHTFLTH